MIRTCDGIRRTDLHHIELERHANGDGVGGQRGGATDPADRTLTITDDDTLGVALSVSPTLNGGTRAAPTPVTVRVGASGTATSGTDYKPHDQLEQVGLSLAEAKELLGRVQERVVGAQASAFLADHRRCGACGKRLWSKGPNLIPIPYAVR